MIMGQGDAGAINELIALLQQVLNAVPSAGENAVEGTGALEGEMGKAQGNPDQLPDNEGLEDEDVNKSSDGPTANDSGEERTEGGETPITEANMGEVAKAIQVLSGLVNKSQAPAQPVQKSNAQEVANIVLKALQPQLERIDAAEGAIGGLLEALGVSDAVNKSIQADNPIDQVNKSIQGAGTPVVNPDANAMLGALGAEIGKQITKSLGMGLPEANQYEKTDVYKQRTELANGMVGMISDKAGYRAAKNAGE